MDAGQFIPGFAEQGHERVVVTTYWGLSAETCAQFRDIAIYLNPAESMGWLGTRGFGRLHRARIFGLIPYGLQPPSPVKEFVTAVFGEESVSVPRHGWIARPVHTVFVPSHLQADLVAGEDVLAVRRRAIWHHPVRNRRIADLARMFASGSCAKLKKSIPGFAKLVFDNEGGRIGVLVASVEHGLALRRYLGWPLLTQDGAITDGLSKCDAARLDSPADNPNLVYHNVIVTTSAMPQAGVFDVLVRADAGVDLPEIYDHHLRGRSGVDDDLLIVDLDDRHHPLVRKWTRGRKAAYLADGWNVTGGPAADAHDRVHVPGRIRQPVLAYQTPHPHRLVEGEERTAEYNYQRRRERRRKQLREKDGGQITLRQIADRDHLMDCFRKLVREGGPAAGIDGISPQQISLKDFGEIAGKLSKAIMEGKWRPQKTRQQPIPKPGTTEKRTLKIGVTLDRIVGKSLHETLQPVWEKLYLKNSFGFRPERSVWQMIAELEATMEKHDRWVLVIDDVRKAFDDVEIAKAIKAHQTAAASKSKGKQLILSDDALKIIEVVLRGHDDHDVGIDQGGCYSPDAMNIFLHTVHDIPLTAVDEVLLWFRYADNLAYVAPSISEGHRVLNLVRRLLHKAGLSLKGEGGITDLNTAKDNPAQLLGFSLWREDGRLRIELGEACLTQLQEHLAQAWNSPDPVKTAITILRGWINANGPAFENGVAVLADVLRLASRLGFRELPEVDELRGWWEMSWQRWRACQRRARRRVLRRQGP